jgi:hypothetical protein
MHDVSSLLLMHIRFIKLNCGSATMIFGALKGHLAPRELGRERGLARRLRLYENGFTYVSEIASWRLQLPSKYPLCHLAGHEALSLPTSGFGCFGRFGKKHFGAPDGLALACWHSETSSSGAQSVQRSRGICMSLRSGEAIPSDGLSPVLRNTFTAGKLDAQVELSICKPLCRC